MTSEDAPNGDDSSDSTTWELATQSSRSPCEPPPMQRFAAAGLRAWLEPLKPGTKTLEQMIAGTDEGIYIRTPSSWSIDDRRENFQLGGEIGWLIKNGKLTEMVKNPVYSGNTVGFWNSCDAIGTPEEYRIWGTPSCGKGQPGQTIATGQGAAPTRFANVKIGG